MITRYNQGFGFFGPMEQCNTGKYVTFEDAIELANNREDEADAMYKHIISNWRALHARELNAITVDHNDLLNAMSNDAKDKITSLQSKLENYMVVIIISVSINLGLLAALLNVTRP